VFNPNSAASLTEALLTLDSNPDLRQTMGQAGRLIVEDFSCERFARSALKAAKTALDRGLPLR
jgi:glycosyltransferase involved in cell wall biosynthesis